ncbi:MAG: malto-oligosyltrehalose synthase, partial [Gammaproteobacteria bacterium]
SHQRCAGVRALCDTLEDGRAKLLIVRSALALRERWREVFQQGSYLPLAVKGEHAAHLCAYARSFGGRTVITVAPRFFVSLLGDAEMLPLGEKVWKYTSVELPSSLGDKQYTCAFTGKVLKHQKRQSRWHMPVAQILTEFPVGLVIGENSLAEPEEL